MKKNKKQIVLAVITIFSLILLMIFLFKIEFDYKNEMDNLEKAIEKEKKSESKMQHGKIKEVKINKSEVEITLDDGLTFKDKSGLSRYVEPRDRIGYVQYQGYQSSKDGVTKGKIKYKVKNIEK